MANNVPTEEEFYVKVIAPARGISITSSATENPIFNGSCHCGFATYQVRLDLVNPNPITGVIVTRCNCTICVKAGLMSIAPTPADSFVLRSPDGGRQELKDYQYPNSDIHRWMCPRCGVQIFSEGQSTYQGTVISWMRVNAVTLDGRDHGERMVELKKSSPSTMEVEKKRLLPWELEMSHGSTVYGNFRFGGRE